MEQIIEFIKPELLILVPVLYILGLGIKKSNVKDNLIPLILGVTSIVLCVLYVVGTNTLVNYKDIVMCLFTTITQGILIAGASVYVNQLLKQSTIEK